jgi:hypothetical protein
LEKENKRKIGVLGVYSRGALFWIVGIPLWGNIFIFLKWTIYLPSKTTQYDKSKHKKKIGNFSSSKDT